MNTFYLDSINVNVSLDGVNAYIAGVVIKIEIQTFGETTVYIDSAKLAQIIIAKMLGYLH